MIKFVNAKINLGLNIVGKCKNTGLHNLETVFLPVGIESGMPQQPEAFDDILEITLDKSDVSGCKFQFMGRRINCPPELNLVVRAASTFLKKYVERYGGQEEIGMFHISLDKHLPDGAGLGGGSADASFVLMCLNEITGKKFTRNELCDMAFSLGADCPFFIYNTPCFAENFGEELTPMEIDLEGKWLLIVKPDVYVSTKEAFSGVAPREPLFDLRFLPDLPLSKWKDYVVNDFEASIFPKFPELAELKENMYSSGAVYSSMSGSGSSIYGIYDSGDKAKMARDLFSTTYSGVWLFEL
ncbi:MAG: 4-(cytidine 5'-diphospho)-2-C-methyl-D-erythritol kinase [Muribaculaceae bacterium]|nr:4-(cytidine 5'-diphospho)-2-C-methyl-D-erythritol kinase [Muribaculaceae bacterium]